MVFFLIVFNNDEIEEEGIYFSSDNLRFYLFCREESKTGKGKVAQDQISKGRVQKLQMARDPAREGTSTI